MANQNLLARIAAGGPGGPSAGDILSQAQARTIAGENQAYTRDQRGLQEQARMLTGQALQGDSAALSGLASVDPAAYSSINTSNEAKAKETRLRASGSAAGAALGVLNAPEAERPALYAASVQHLKAQHPGVFDSVSDVYDADQFRSMLPGILADAPEGFRTAVIERAYPKPKEVTPTGDIQNYEYAKRNGYTGSFQEFGQEMKAHGGGNGADPYYTPLQSSQGFYSFNNRTGQANQLGDLGAPVLPVAADPTLKRTMERAGTEGKGAGEATVTANTRVRDAGSVLDLVSEAEKLIPKATGSMPGNVADQAAAAVGVATPGAEATAQLRTIAGQIVSKMPRMEGPQSNFDVQLYQQMAGDLANPNTPAATRLAAAKQIRALNEKYAKPAASQPAAPPPPGAPPMRNVTVDY